MDGKLSFHNLAPLLMRSNIIRKDGTVNSENRIILYNESKLSKDDIEQMILDGTLMSRKDVVILTDETAEMLADL